MSTFPQCFSKHSTRHSRPPKHCTLPGSHHRPPCAPSPFTQFVPEEPTRHHFSASLVQKAPLIFQSLFQTGPPWRGPGTPVLLPDAEGGSPFPVLVDRHRPPPGTGLQVELLHALRRPSPAPGTPRLCRGALWVSAAQEAHRGRAVKGLTTSVTTHGARDLWAVSRLISLHSSAIFSVYTGPCLAAGVPELC